MKKENREERKYLRDKLRKARLFSPREKAYILGRGILGSSLQIPLGYLFLNIFSELAVKSEEVLASCDPNLLDKFFKLIEKSEGEPVSLGIAALCSTPFVIYGGLKWASTGLGPVTSYREKRREKEKVSQLEDTLEDFKKSIN